MLKEEEVIAHREVVEDKKVNITTIYHATAPSGSLPVTPLDAQFDGLLIVIRANKYLQLYTSPK